MILELFPPRTANEKEGLFFRGTAEYKLRPEWQDSFRIAAGPDRCLIEGGPNGLLYAHDLAEELQRVHGGIPCAEYSDSPDQAFRCYHMDLKKGAGGIADIKRSLLRLRTLRYNHVLIEYENRIRLDSVPEIAASDALGKDEIREIVRFAKDNGITIIPLLQSFGHLEYLLKIPEYRKYSDHPEDLSQICPLDDEFFEWWKQIFDEMLELHAGADYFHIGGDEAYRLGSCPKCAAYVKEHSEAELYFHHIERICRHAADRGCTPMLWHDMLARADRFDLMAKLPEKTVFVYWMYYSPVNISRFIMLSRHGVYASRNWIGKIRSYKDFEDAPHQFAKFLEDAPESDQLRAQAATVRPDKTEFDPLPFMKGLRQTGHRIFGATALGSAANKILLEDSDRSYRNMKLWMDSGMDGMIATRWAAATSIDPAQGPLSLRDYSLVIDAELMWKKTLSAREIEERYDRSCGPKIRGLAGWLSVMVYSDREWYPNWSTAAEEAFAAYEPDIVPEMLPVYRKYLTALRAEVLVRKIQLFIKNSSGQLAESRYGKTLYEQIEPVKETLRKGFADEFPPESIEDWLKRVFEPYDALFKGLYS